MRRRDVCMFLGIVCQSENYSWDNYEWRMNEMNDPKWSFFWRTCFLICLGSVCFVVCSAIRSSIKCSVYFMCWFFLGKVWLLNSLWNLILSICAVSLKWDWVWIKINSSIGEANSPHKCDNFDQKLPSKLSLIFRLSFIAIEFPSYWLFAFSNSQIACFYHIK